MNNWDNPAIAQTGLVRGLAALVLLVMVSTGCMYSGASSYTERAESDEMREVPLDVAGESGLEPGVWQDDSQSPAEAQPPMQELTTYGTPTADPLTTASLLPDEETVEQMIKPEESAEVMNLRRDTEARLAALSTGVPAFSDRFILPDFENDPEELAANLRIPALYSSIDHGRCKGGWGPKPKMINARRVNPDHTYYMEMRMRHTPLLPVGHVYIAYGRLGPFGNPVDERLTMLSPLGGYVGAGIASTVPMPGILKPVGSDCKVVPEAAYRVTLSAVEYEKLLLAIKEQQHKKPTYHLFAYNCNHYLSEVAAAVGILPPNNIYQPSLTYLYALMDRNENHKVPRTPAGWTSAAKRS